MNTLSSRKAMRVIQQLGGPGQPPEYGVQYFTVGLDPYLDVIDQEYLKTFIADGGSAFKLVVGIYGGGKTHFLYCVRDLAWQHDFAVSYVSLKAGGECPFDKLELVYKAIVGGLLPPITDPEINPDEEKGIENFLRRWYTQRNLAHRQAGMSAAAAQVAVKEEIEDLAGVSMHSISFRNALVHGLRAIAEGREESYSLICQWFKGEMAPNTQLKRLNIAQKVDRSTAFSFIRSLGQAVRAMGYNGLVVLLDEAEQVPSLRRSQRDQLLSNLREFIDECGNSMFQGMMVFYAVPDGGFLNGHTAVYQALQQRLSTTFESLNPTGVRIELDDAVADPVEFLCQVGARIVPIYNTAHFTRLPEAEAQALVGNLADLVARQRFADAGYKRLFVQRLVKGLGILHKTGYMPSAQELG